MYLSLWLCLFYYCLPGRPIFFWYKCTIWSDLCIHHFHQIYCKCNFTQLKHVQVFFFLLISENKCCFRQIWMLLNIHSIIQYLQTLRCISVTATDKIDQFQLQCRNLLYNCMLQIRAWHVKSNWNCILSRDFLVYIHFHKLQHFQLRKHCTDLSS